MDIPEEFWDWDFRRQRAWFFMVLPGAPYDKIEAGHGTALAAASWRFPREFCNLAPAEQEAFLHWQTQVNTPTPPSGWVLYDPWNQTSDRAQVATAIAAACRAGMLQSLLSGPTMIAEFRDDARAFGGARALTAWARANPAGYHDAALAFVAGRAAGSAPRAAAHVYPSGQVTTRRLHAPVRRSRLRPRLSVNRTTSGRVTVTPVQTSRSAPSPSTSPITHPPQPPEGYVPPPADVGSIMGPPIVVGSPHGSQPAPTPTTTPATFHPTAPATTIPSAGVSPFWIVGGVAVVLVGGYLLLRPSRSPSVNGFQPR